MEWAGRHGIDLGCSWMVGDQERDVEAGRRAGCRTILMSAEGGESQADHRVRNLRELKTLVERIL